MSTTAKKPSTARRKLADVESKLAEVAAQEAGVRAEQAAVARKADDLGRQIEESIRDGGPVGDDVTAQDLAVRSMHAEYAQADARARSPHWKRTLAGLASRRSKLEGERTLIVRDNLPALIAELASEAHGVGERTRAAFAAVEAARAEWAGIDRAWRSLERDGHLTGPVGRLDAPPFPIRSGDVGDVVDPIPRVVADDLAVLTETP